MLLFFFIFIKDGETAIFTYAYNMPCLKLLVSRGADINALNKRGETAIKRICRRPSGVLGIKNLIELGASLSIPKNTLVYNSLFYLENLK